MPFSRREWIVIVCVVALLCAPAIDLVGVLPFVCLLSAIFLLVEVLIAPQHFFLPGSPFLLARSPRPPPVE